MVQCVAASQAFPNGATGLPKDANGGQSGANGRHPDSGVIIVTMRKTKIKTTTKLFNSVFFIGKSSHLNSPRRERQFLQRSRNSTSDLFSSSLEEKYFLMPL